jgi:hypothetical protein
MTAKKTTEQFIAEANVAHDGKYDYSKTMYVGARDKVIITCPIHGDFEQLAGNHLRPCGCPGCTGDAIRKGRKFSEYGSFDIEAARAKHGEKYDYSKVKFRGLKSKVSIVCPEHGIFMQSPEKHYEGNGCPECGRIKCHAYRRHTLDTFIEKARAVHGDAYDYSEARIGNSDTRKVKIICPEHGSFWQNKAAHLFGRGCRACGDLRTGAAQKMSHDEFIAKARLIHDDKYSYVDSVYLGSKEKVEIICPDHGPFWQQPDNHLFGQGCPSCADGYGPSKGEREVFNYIKALCPDAEQSVVGLLGDRRELDIVIPSKKIAIEFNGLIWHSAKYGKGRTYHQDKTDDAALAGYRLIHIWEDEWRDKRAWCEAFLDRLCGAPNRKVFARKCDLREIDSAEALPFLAANHLQGARGGCHIALFHGDELVAVATHARNSIGENELIRWCVKLGVSVVGGFSRVMKHLPKDTISFCDTAKHAAEGYFASGWKVISETPPMYFYTDGRVRNSRQKFQKHKLVARGAVGNTEREMATSLGFYQIGGLKQLKLAII